MTRLSRIAPEMPATDLRSALQYYLLRLGFTVAMELRDYAIVERDGASIHLFEDRVRSHSPVGIHVFTQDLDDLYLELQQSGALLKQGIEKKPWGNREFRVNDEFGNEIKFTEPA